MSISDGTSQGQVVTISRDPFARVDIIRQEVPANGRTCAWCGGLNARGNLFAYGSEADGILPGRRHLDTRHLFCAKGCHDAYHS